MAIDRITTGAVLDGAIATADIADDAVTGAKLANDVAIANDLAVANDLTVDTNTLFVDASADKVGINQTSPTYQLSVLGATQSTVEIESASNTGESRLYFTDPDSTGTGEVGYYHNGDTMRFATGGAERMRLSSAGLHIGGTGAANALDDYEEGTWTATYGSSGSNTGVYTKIGRLVNVHVILNGTNQTISAGAINGLPFAVDSSLFAGSVGRVIGMGGQNRDTIGIGATGSYLQIHNAGGGANAITTGGGTVRFDLSVTYFTTA